MDADVGAVIGKQLGLTHVMENRKRPDRCGAHLNHQIIASRLAASGYSTGQDIEIRPYRDGSRCFARTMKDESPGRMGRGNKDK